MSDNNGLNISRRRALAGIGAIGVASAGAGVGTSAYFSDTESFENNTLTAGELDLKVGWQQTYNGPNPGNGGAVESHPVNAFPDSQGDGIQDLSGVIYGVEFDDTLYLIDLQENEAIEISDSGGTPDSDSSPNGIAFDPNNGRLYYSVNTDSGSEIWFYDFGSNSNTKAGDLNAQAAGAGWYDGRYWYIKNETDDLNAVTFNSNGTKSNETTELADLTSNDREYRFGDLAITPDGLLYASTLDSSPSTAEFFTVDIPSGSGTYTELYTGSESDWGGDRGGDPTGLQLAVGQDGTLYGQDAGSGEFFEIDVGAKQLTSVTSINDLTFTDISSREDIFLICTRPAPTTPDAFQSSNYPNQEHLVELSDVKPGDRGEITFSLRLCDNPGYIWLTAGNYSQDGGVLTEPERAAINATNETITDVANVTDSDDTGLLADHTMVRIWYDEDCDNEFDDGGDSGDGEQLIFGPGIGGYTGFGGENPATLAAAMELILDGDDSGRIPLDGEAPRMGWNAGEDASERECLPGETGMCIGVEWWVPTQVGNIIQGDSVTFDLGFYTEQCRHNDGSGQS